MYCTVTLKVQVWLPEALLAVQVTTVVPNENKLPLAVVQPKRLPLETVGLG